MNVPEALDGLGPVLWLGSFVGCGLGLLLSWRCREPIHRIAWARLAIVTTTSWMLIALVPFERLGREQASKPERTTAVVLYAPTPDLVESPLVQAPSIEAAPIQAPPARFGPAMPDEFPFVEIETEEEALAAIPVTAQDLEEMRRAAEALRAPTADPMGTPLWLTLWIAGAIGVFACWLFAGLRLHVFLRRCRRAGSEADALLRDSAPRARLAVAPTGTTPFCSGFLRPRVVVPEELLSPSQRDALRAVLAHESAHLQQRDLMTTLLVRVCAVALWSQPLFWILARRIRRDAERRADDRAAENLGRATYARQLIELVQSCGRPSPRAALSMSANHSDFYRRMESLMKRETPLQQRVGFRTRVLRSASAGALCVAAIAVFGRDVSAQDPARMKRIEDRLARLESRLESMTSLLEKIVKREVEASLVRSDPEAPRAGRAPQNFWTQSQNDSALGAANLLLKAFQDRQRLRTQVEQSKTLAENSLISEQQLRSEETQLELAETQVKLLSSTLKRQLDSQRVVVDELKSSFARREALFEQGVVSQNELSSGRVKLLQGQARLESLEDVMRILDQRTSSNDDSPSVGPSAFGDAAPRIAAPNTQSMASGGIDLIRTTQELLQAVSDKRRLAAKVESSRPLAGKLISAQQFREDEAALQRATSMADFLSRVLEREQGSQMALLSQLEQEADRKRALVENGSLPMSEAQAARTRVIQARARMGSLEDAMRLYREAESKQPDTRRKPRRFLNNANVAKARQDLKSIFDAAQVFKMTNNRVPTVEDLVTPDEKGRAYLEGLTNDPWDNAYEIVNRKSRTFAVVSNGPDGKRGTEDDLVHPIQTRKND